MMVETVTFCYRYTAIICFERGQWREFTSEFERGARVGRDGVPVPASPGTLPRLAKQHALSCTDAKVAHVFILKVRGI